MPKGAPHPWETASWHGSFLLSFLLVSLGKISCWFRING